MKDVGARNQSSIISVDAFRELKEFNDGVFEIVTRIDSNETKSVSVKGILDKAKEQYNQYVFNEKDKEA